MKKLMTMLAAVVVGGSLVAQAGPGGSVTNTVTWAFNLTDWTNVQTVAQFDAGLGVLTSVVYQVTDSMDTKFYITNQEIYTNATSDGTAHSRIKLSIRDQGGYFISDTPPQITNDFPSPEFSWTGLATNSSVTSSLYSVSSTNGWFTHTDANTLTEFTGGGNVSLTGATLAGTVLFYTGGNTIADQTSHAGATATIIYNYIPEPSVAMLGGIGVLAMLMRRRLVRKR